MQIEVVRRGGFAGMTVRGIVDTADLPANTAALVEAAVEALPFGRAPAPAKHPDSFQYEINLMGGESRRSITLGESEVPGELLPMLRSAISKGELEPGGA